MYQLINQNSAAVLDQIARLDVANYIWLCEQLAIPSGNACSDTEFQKRYRKYWSMNAARLNASFYEKYFGLLSSYVRSHHKDVRSVVEALSYVDRIEPGPLHFSFATKLIHMVDPRQPIYDSFVAAFYFFKPPSNEMSFSDRLDRLMRFDQFLKDEYERIIANGMLRQSFGALRSRFSIGGDICDERLVDWLIWGWVSLLRKQTDHRSFYS